METNEEASAPDEPGTYTEVFGLGHAPPGPILSAGGLPPSFEVVGETYPIGWDEEDWAAWEEERKRAGKPPGYAFRDNLGRGLAVLPRKGGGGVLAASPSGTRMLFFDGDSLVGTRGPEDAVGSLGVAPPFTGHYHVPHAAGDVNRDGHVDVWVGTRLFLMPVVGDRSWEDDWYAGIDNPIGPHAWGGVDADGDGEPDVVVFGREQHGSVHYGPFRRGDLRRRAWDRGAWADMSEVTLFRGGCGEAAPYMNQVVTVGRSIVGVVGANTFVGSCTVGTHWFALSGPRGRILEVEDATVIQNGHYLRAGDVDGDGSFDWALSDTLLYGPAATMYDRPVLRLDRGQFVGSPGDLDGDGMDEMVAVCDELRHPEHCQGRVLWLLFGSNVRSGPTTYMDEGLQLDASGFSMSIREGRFSAIASGDLDGDGVPELLLSDDNAHWGRGRIAGWSGAALLQSAGRR